MTQFAGNTENHRLRHRPADLLLAGLVLAAMMALSTERAHATNFGELLGNWRGWGWVTLNNGGRERVRCYVKYSSPSGNRLSQNVRCASTSYKIDAVSNLVRRGTSLTGSWSEKSFDVSGSISGRAVADGFMLTLTGDIFSAGMSVQVNKCRQSLNINVRGIDIRSVTMGLKKLRSC